MTSCGATIRFTGNVALFGTLATFTTLAAIACNNPPSPQNDVEQAPITTGVCHEAQDTYAMRECLSGALAAADSSLRIAVDSLRFRSNNALLVDSAQSAWLEFRRLACAVEGSQYEGGTLAPVAILNCMVTVTNMRDAAVRARLRVP